MLKDVLKTYTKIYKNPIKTSTIQNSSQNYKNTFEFDKDTEFLLNQISPNSSFQIPNKKATKKNKNKNISAPKQAPKKHKHHDGDCSNCVECHPYFRMLKKQRKQLVNFINNNQTRNIKLIGNNRYSRTSPKKYVHDNDRKLSSRKMGIIPIPLNKKKKNLTVLESIDYHELQRSIVMMRRLQYDRKIRKGAFYNYLDDVIFIQRWWRDLKKLEKTKIIQKNFRKFLNRKKLKIRKRLKENSIKIKKIMNKIIFKKCFNKIKSCKYTKKPFINTNTKITKRRNINKYINRLNNNCLYISKKRIILSKISLNKIIDLQNNYRIFKAVQKKNNLLLNQKIKPRNKSQNLFTKVTVNESLLNEKITLLQRNIRYFLYENKKKKIIKINRKKEKFGLYIDKIQLKKYSLKIFEFIKKLKHVMQIIALKRRTKYKSIKDYNINDIDKISKIQNVYKLHYNKYHINKKDLIKIYSNKSSINCFISKSRIKKNNRVLVLMQKALKTTLKRIRFEKNIIKNKPKSIDFNKVVNYNVISIPKAQKINLEIINDNNNNYNNNEINKNQSLSISNIKNDINENVNLREKRNKNNILNNNNFSIIGINHNDEKEILDKNNNKILNNSKILNNNRFDKSSNENINIMTSREFNKNNINYNLVSLITKKRKLNVSKKLILLQRTIKSYLFIKKAKLDYYSSKNCLFINKININKNFYITKKHTNENEYIQKINYFQKYYKKRFHYLKNNIIKFTISTDREEEYLRLPEKIISNFTANGNNKYNNVYNIDNLLNDNQRIIKIPNKNTININTIESDSFAIGNEAKKEKQNNKLRRHSYQMEKNKIILLSYLVEKNRRPVIQLIGNYYEKIRIESGIYDQFVKNKNKNFIMKNESNRGLYISKKRYKNNNEEINLIQNKYKGRLKLKKNKEEKEKEKDIIIKKPLNQNYIIVNDKIKEDKNKKRKEKNRSTYKFKQDYLDEDEIEEDSYFEDYDGDFTDIVGEKIYTIYNKNNIIRQPHLNMNNYYYISKIRMVNDIEDISSQKEYEIIKSDLKLRRSKDKTDSNIISKKSSPVPSLFASPNSINSKKIEFVKKFDKEKSISLNEEEEINDTPRFNFDHKSLCYIQKIRFKNNKILQKVKNFIKNQNENKNYLYNNRSNGSILDEIKSNVTFGKMKIDDKINLKNSGNFINDLNNKSNNIDITLNNINNDINRINSNINNSINNNVKDNNGNYNSNKWGIGSNYNSYSNYSEKVSNGGGVVSRDTGDKYIIKNKRNNNKININDKINYFHNKMYYLNFIQLLNLFLIKNTQEYIFYKLLVYYQYYNTKNKIKNKNKYFIGYNNSKFSFPFYILSLTRIFKYILNKNKQNKRIQSFFNLIFPSLDKNKSFFHPILCLTFENKKKLINTNLYNLDKEKKILVEFLDDFSKFDKKTSNKAFIKDKINKTIFHNTNIFTLIKLIDKETKLKNGIYCVNCYQKENICSCANKKFNNNIINGTENDDEEEIFYFDLNGDTESKSGQIVVNYFIDENDKDVNIGEIMKNIKKNQIICIKKKPKIGLKNKNPNNDT